MAITKAAIAMLTDTGITQSHFCVIVAGVIVDSGDSVTEGEYSWIMPTTICSKDNFSWIITTTICSKDNFSTVCLLFQYKIKCKKDTTLNCRRDYNYN